MGTYYHLLDATKTAVVWTGDLQVGATLLARDIRAALRAY